MIYQRDLNVFKNKDTLLKCLFVVDQKLRSFAPKSNVDHLFQIKSKLLTAASINSSRMLRNNWFVNQGWLNKTQQDQDSSKKLIGKCHRAYKNCKKKSVGAQ